MVRLGESLGDVDGRMQRAIDDEFSLARLLPRQFQFRAYERQPSLERQREASPWSGILEETRIVDADGLPPVIDFQHDRAKKIASDRALVDPSGLRGEIFPGRCRKGRWRELHSWKLERRISKIGKFEFCGASRIDRGSRGRRVQNEK